MGKRSGIGYNRHSAFRLIRASRCAAPQARIDHAGSDSLKTTEETLLMAKKFMTFRHWKTDEVKTIEFKDADVPVNPSSERLVVWNETEQKLEDVIKSTIVEIREE
jgi:hypothetical protein